MLKKLTPAENLWLSATQKNISQHKLLESLGITAYAYSQDPERYKSALSLTPPSVLQWCVIFRKRKGMTLPELAAALGLSREYICYMEKGRYPHTHLITYWSKSKNVPSVFKSVVSSWTVGANGNRSNKKRTNNNKNVNQARASG